MSDFNSSLPVRTENDGDVVVKVGDGTTPSQQLAVTSSGHIQTDLNDGAGTALTSTLNAGKQSLDVNITGGSSSGAVTDQSTFTYGSSTETPIGGVFQDTSPTLTAGQTGAVRLTSQRGMHINLRNASGTEIGTASNPVRIDPTGSTAQPVSGTVSASNFPSTVDTNYGTVGASTIRTAAQVGNATGAADFNYGTVGAQTLRTASQIGNATGAANFNYGTIGAQSLRTAAQIGNATGAADFNSGATGAQTLRVEANQGAPNSIGNAWPVKPTDGTNSQSYTASGEAKVDVTQPLPAGTNNIGKVSIQDSSGSAFSESNPLPVEISFDGTPVDDFKDASSIAANASDNHDYTVTAGKTLYLDSINSSGSGKAKMQVEIETGVATGTFNTYFVQFNSTAEPNMNIKWGSGRTVAAGVRVRIVMTNLDKASQDLYSTVSGHEE